MCTPRAVCVLGCFLTVIGFTLVAIMLSEMYPRYKYTKDYIRTECEVNSIEYYGDICCVTFISNPDIWDLTDCHGVLYPCYGVKVSYTDAYNVSSQGKLFGGYSDVMYQGDNLTCSYYSCGSDNSSSSQAVSDWLSKNGAVGSVYTCWYDPHDTNTVIKDVIFRQPSMIHSLLWSSLLLIAGIVVICVGWWAHRRALQQEEELHLVLLEAADGLPEIRTEGLYGYQNAGPSVDEDSNRPNTATTVGLTVNPDDLGGNTLNVSGSTKA